MSELVQRLRLRDIHDALREIRRRLNGVQSPWVVTGGANLVLQGCWEDAGDIDLLTTNRGAEEIAQRLISDETRTLERTRSGNVESMFFQVTIGRALVQVMGAPSNLLFSRWIPNSVWLHFRMYIEMECDSVPVAALDYELYVSALLGNCTRVECIRRCLGMQKECARPTGGGY